MSDLPTYPPSTPLAGAPTASAGGGPAFSYYAMLSNASAANTVSYPPNSSASAYHPPSFRDPEIVIPSYPPTVPAQPPQTPAAAQQKWPTAGGRNHQEYGAASSSNSNIGNSSAASQPVSRPSGSTGSGLHLYSMSQPYHPPSYARAPSSPRHSPHSIPQPHVSHYTSLSSISGHSPVLQPSNASMAASAATHPPNAPPKNAHLNRKVSWRDRGGNAYTTEDESANKPLAAYHRESDADDETSERFHTGHKCRDCFFAVLFLAHFILMVITAIYYYTRDSSTLTRDDSSDKDGDGRWQKLNPHAWSLIGLYAALNVLFLIVWLIILSTQAERIIWITLIAPIFLLFIQSLVCFSIGQQIVAVLLLVATAVQIGFVFAIRRRVKFTATMIELASKVLQLYPSTIILGICAVFVEMAWIIVWYTAFASAMASLAEKHVDNDAANFVVFLFLVSLYWTSQVIRNVIHVTVAGVSAAWYFLYPVSMPENPTYESFIRAITTSFGSICLGSLITAILRAIRALVNLGTKSRSSAIRSMVQCLLDQIDRLVEMFNSYAFTQVAMYGRGFVESSRSAWSIIKSRGLDLIINHNLTTPILVLGAVMGGVLSCIVGTLFAKFILVEFYWQFYAVLGFIFGFCVMLVVMEVMRSAQMALLLCWFDDPLSLHNSKIDVYDRLNAVTQAALAGDGSSLIRNAAGAT